MTMPGLGKCLADDDPASNATHPTESKQDWSAQREGGFVSGRRQRLVALAAFLFVGLFQGDISLAGATAGAESVQTPLRSLPTITTAHEAHSLTSVEAAREYPIHLRAVVTYVDPNVGLNRAGLFVHDPTGSIFVSGAQDVLNSLRPGSLIDLRGVSNPGEFAPIVAQARIQVIGHSGLPAATDQPAFSRLLSAAEDGQWVEVEGVIHSFNTGRPSRQPAFDTGGWEHHGLYDQGGRRTIFSPGRRESANPRQRSPVVRQRPPPADRHAHSVPKPLGSGG
jgi:hypothetical protein